MSIIAVAAYNNLSVTAALPSIGNDLGNLDLLPWVITAELIASAVAVLAIGPFIDAVGSRRAFRSVIIWFTATSAACAFAPTMGTLIAARFTQGLASGALIAIALAAIGLGVPERLRARAYATNSTMWGTMGLAGPAIAASLLTIGSWPLLFWINVPIAIGAGFIGWNVFPEAALAEVGVQRQGTKPDAKGLAILSIATLASLVGVSTLEWRSSGFLLVAAVMFLVYRRYERTVESPVLRMRHLANPLFRWLHVTALLVIISGVATSAFLPVYLKGSVGLSTFAASTSVVFFTVGWTFGAYASSAISERRRGVDVIWVGTLILLVASTVTALAIVASAPVAVLYACMFCLAIGVGAVSSTGIGVLTASARASEMGRVSSAHQFIRTLGFTYGAAIGGGLLFGAVSLRLGSADAVRSLLGEEEAMLETAATAAIHEGYTWSSWASVVSAAFAVVASTKLRSVHRAAEGLSD